MQNQIDKKELERQFTEIAVRHRKAIQQFEKKIEEYKELYNTLTYIPQKLEQECMIPMGSHGLAYFPGRLIQTNEVTVAVGDDYFIKTSAHHAREILKRRITQVVQHLENERKLLHALYERMGLSKHSTSIIKSKPTEEEDDFQEVSEAENIEKFLKGLDKKSSVLEDMEKEDVTFEYNSRNMGRDKLHYRHETTTKDEMDIQRLLNKLEKEELEDQMEQLDLDEEEDGEEEEEDSSPFGEEDIKLQQEILKYFHKAPPSDTKPKEVTSKPTSTGSSSTGSFKVVERDVVSPVSKTPSSSSSEPPKKLSKFKQRMMENK